MSRGWKKRKISDSDSEIDISSNDESDDFLISESGCEDESINNDNDLENSNLLTDKESDESCEESDVPLSTRQSKLKSDFKWTDQDVFNPIIHPFKDDNHGVQPSSGLTSRSSPVEIFKTIWDENLVDIICAQTNSFAESKKNNLMEKGKLKKNSRILKFSPVEIDEMYAFHALVILMGIIKKPQLSMYWTTTPTLQTPVFKNCMAYDRFRLILSMLHFQSDFDVDNNDALVKIRPVLEYLLEKFQATYRPGENIAIDESLLLWKGRLSFKQFNRNKRARFGIKLYQTCESKTGYSYNIKVYIGKKGNDSYIDKRIGISGQVVKDMLLDLGGQGRTLYIDNWYSSPSLFYQLLNEKTNVCGTVRLNRRYLPKINTKCIKKGEMKVFHTPKLCLIAWHDKKIVSMLTTKHAPELIDTGKKNPRTGEPVMKPNIVMAYNSYMGGVDLLDQSTSAYPTTRKTIKWYQKVYFYLLNVSLYNSFVIFKALHSETKMTFLDFKILIVEDLLKVHRKLQNAPKKQVPGLDKRLTNSYNHFPAGKGKYENGRQKFQPCIMCRRKKIRKETPVICEKCNVPLCAFPCFKEFHN